MKTTTTKSNGHKAPMRAVPPPADETNSAAGKEPQAAPAAASPEVAMAISGPAAGLFQSLHYPTERGWSGPIAQIKGIRADAMQVLSVDRSGKSPDFDEFRAIVKHCDLMLQAYENLGGALRRVARTNPARHPEPGTPP